MKYLRYLGLLLLTASMVLGQGVIGPINQSIGSLPNASGSPTAWSGLGVTNAQTVIYSNLVWFTTSARASGIPRLLSIDFESDIIANRMLVFSSTNSASITNSQGTTNVINCSVAGFASNDYVLIQYSLPDVYQLAQVTNVAGGGLGINKTTAWGLTNSGTQVDKVWQLTQIGRLGQSAATNFPPTGSPYFTGREGTPLVFIMGFSNAAAINRCTGDYWQRPRP